MTIKRTSINLNAPGELPAFLPYVLGFYPTRSLVVIALRDRNAVDFGCRVDLPEDNSDNDAIAETLRVPLLTRHIEHVLLVVLTERDEETALPWRQLVENCSATWSAAGITVVEALWAGSVHAGAAWRSYHDAQRTGRVTDLNATPLHAATVLAGSVVFNDRDDMVALLDPDPAEDLTRRETLLQELDNDDHYRRRTAADHLTLLHTAIDRAAHGILPETDRDIVDLTGALCDHEVRDACLILDTEERSLAAERLWTHLVRSTPAPELAEPASLLAVAAHLRGDGTLAGIALQRAHQADPHHRLTSLLTAALQAGMGPARLQDALRESSRRSAASIATDQEQS